MLMETHQSDKAVRYLLHIQTPVMAAALQLLLLMSHMLLPRRDVWFGPNTAIAFVNVQHIKAP